MELLLLPLMLLLRRWSRKKRSEWKEGRLELPKEPRPPLFLLVVRERERSKDYEGCDLRRMAMLCWEKWRVLRM